MKRTRGVALCAVALVAANAAESLAGEGPTDAPPRWLKHPNSKDLLSVWPKGALERGLGGQAVIQCKVSLQGSLFGCFVVSETPSGAGFGGAAIALTPQLLMRPALKSGQPVVGEVRIPIDFPTPDAPTGSHLRGGRGAHARERIETIYSDVPWVAAPSYGEVVAAYPDRARKSAVGGRATLNCRITTERRLKSCDIIAEAPMAMGFGQAARSLADRFEAPARGPKGETLDGAYTQISVAFAPEMLDAAHQVIGKPRWATLPSGESFRDAYPAAAKAAGVRQARVVMQCGVAATGALEDCSVRSEAPEGLGFGAATLSLSSGFRLNLWTAEGLPVVGGRVVVPVRYDVPADAPKP